MTKKEITELLQRNLNLKHETQYLAEELKKAIEKTESLKLKLEQNEGHQFHEIETLKSEKEFLMQTINALTKLTNNLIK